MNSVQQDDKERSDYLKQAQDPKWRKISKEEAEKLLARIRKMSGGNDVAS
jgi:hypothetical protein